MGQAVLFCLLPDIEDILHAAVDLAPGIIRQHVVDQALVQGALSAVVGDPEHVVDGRIQAAGPHSFCPLSKGSHHVLLNPAGF